MRLYPGIRACPYIRKYPYNIVCKIPLKISVLMILGHLKGHHFCTVTPLVIGCYTRKIWPGESLIPKYVYFLFWKLSFYKNTN